jgi:hypothetical protein
MARDTRSVYQRRNERAIAQGFSGYGAMRAHKRKYGETARSSPVGRQMGGDLDTTSVRRRIHEAVATWDNRGGGAVNGPDGEEIDDWEFHSFSSSRCNAARYSPSRQQLIMDWTNSPGGPPPYPAYIYDAVPPAVWTGLRTAGSAGRFVNHTLNTFPYRPTGQTV